MNQTTTLIGPNPCSSCGGEYGQHRDRFGKPCPNAPVKHVEFGMFGLDFRQTKRMLNRLLKPHGLTLKVKTNRKEWGDQSEVSIEPFEESK